MANDNYSELERLWALKESGALSEAEFQELKARALGSKVVPPIHSPPSLLGRAEAESSRLPSTVAKGSTKRRHGCLLGGFGALALLIVVAAIAPKQKVPDEGQPGSPGSGAAAAIEGAQKELKYPALVSRAQFRERGLKWPLTVEEGKLGCTRLARWVEVNGSRYGLNGSASAREGYLDLFQIWAVDEKMAADLRAAGIPNEPPLRVNVGDMIEEAGRFC